MPKPELLNASIDTCGGMASEAHALVSAIGEEGERWSAGTWSAAGLRQQLLSAIAVVVQRGNAMTVLSGFTKVASAHMGRSEEEWTEDV